MAIGVRVGHRSAVGERKRFGGADQHWRSGVVWIEGAGVYSSFRPLKMSVPLWISRAKEAATSKTTWPSSNPDLWWQHVMLAFVMAEGCLIWVTAKITNHTEHRGIYNVTNLSCQEVPKGVFAVGAGLVMLTLLIYGLNYLAFLRAKEQKRSAFMVSLIPNAGDCIVGIDNN